MRIKLLKLNELQKSTTSVHFENRVYRVLLINSLRLTNNNISILFINKLQRIF
jgi:hypothetical protein